MKQLLYHWLGGLVFLLLAFSAQADYRDSPKSKLDAARQYADNFLKEDAKAGQQFFHRDPKFPVWKDQPVIDCAVYGIMRAIQTRDPYFEDQKQTVVIVPVWVELLMLNVNDGAGFPFSGNEEGVIQCKFEYQQYSFVTKRFEEVPDLLKKQYLQTIRNWGELVPRNEGVRDGDIAINADKRYVQFKFRVSVARAAPYQLYPQFPRHHPVVASIFKLSNIVANQEARLAQGISDRDPSATGSELAKDLVRMRRQKEENLWAVTKLEEMANRLKSIQPFSDIQLW